MNYIIHDWKILLLSVIKSLYVSFLYYAHHQIHCTSVSGAMMLTINTVSWTNVVVVVAAILIVYWPAGYSHALTQQQQQSPLSPGAASSSSLTTRDNNNNVGKGKIMISPFIDSRWIVRLDIGLEPGSFMPQRFPEWAVSGARLGVPVELWFTNNNVAEVPDNVTALFGIGNNDKVKVNNIIPTFRRVEVSPMTINSTFVSERGQECVSFVGGGYSMERSSLYYKNDDLTLLGIVEGIPKPRFLLRFWIDCTSGAKRNDVELKPFSRIIGTIPMWDDPDQITRLQKEKTLILQEKEQKQKTTKKKKKNRQDEYDPMNPNASCNDDDIKSKSKSFLRKWLFFEGKYKTDNSNDDVDDESSLEYRQEQLERLLPLKGSLTFDNGVTTAPKGSLVIPYYQDEKEDESFSLGSGVRKQHKYLIVGSFSMKHSNG
jgi:hypothetical protein